jgi:hypothetical protein
MDFHLIHRHPWITTGAILGGGFVLYLLLHKRSSAPSEQVAYTGVAAGGGGMDPNLAAQLAGQQMQAQAQISGLSIQGQTQIELSKIGAGVQYASIGASQDITNRQTAATQDVTNRQTDAQLQLGLGTLGAQVASEQINANVQMRTIDAIVAAFTGNHPITNPTPTVTVPVGNNTNNPISGINPPQTTGVNQPVYYGAGSAGGPSPASTGGIITGSGQNLVVPGGTQLLPYPTYVHSDPAQYPGMAPGATCSPLDATCVAQNAAISNQYHVDVANAQTVNNLTQLVQNYQQSAIGGTITPAQRQEMDFYSQQLAAAGGTVPTYTAAPMRVFPAQVNTF